MKKIGAITILCLLGLQSALAAPRFPDINDSQFKIPIEFTTERNIVSGYPDGTFRPEKKVNRAEMLKIVMESSFKDIPDNFGCTDFSDVPIHEWFTKYICLAKSRGIIEGYSDKTFRPSQNISIVEALKIIEKAYGVTTTPDEHTWYRPYVEYATNKDLLPLTIRQFDQQLTRGEMTDIITRFLKEKEGNISTYRSETNTHTKRISYECLETKTCPIDDSRPQPTNTPKTSSAPHLSYDAERHAKLPACENVQLTHPFVDLNKIYEITPLGNIGPPGHTLPTEHMYFHISAGGETTNTIDLQSPTKGHILSVTSTINSKEKAADYTFTIALCKDVFIYFNHVKALSTNIEKELETVSCTKFSSDPYADNPDISYCAKDTFIAIEPQTPLGKVGHLQGNFDFGAYDYRSKNTFANPARYGNNAGVLFKPRSLYITCPIDLYTDLKPQFYGKIKRLNGNRCGNVMQDLPGTLQGNWFYGNKTADTGWAESLSFAEDNNDPSKSVLAIGGTITNPLKITFTPQESGETNRRFADVTPSTIAYCYEIPEKPERILIQMTDETTIKIEHQTKLCSAPRIFEKPFTYKR